jgi:organic hydroperoxide reductase OsmC/OhrA
MTKEHHYLVEIEWTGNSGTGTTSYKSYERSHTLRVAGKVEIHCSSDPNFRGDKTKHNPEELFVASISSCHMLWFLHLCAVNDIVVTDYVDNAIGIMEEMPSGEGRFVSVTLNPIVNITEASKSELANKLHEEANRKCFIANSCNFKISHNPVCKS